MYSSRSQTIDILQDSCPQISYCRLYRRKGITFIHGLGGNNFNLKMWLHMAKLPELPVVCLHQSIGAPFAVLCQWPLLVEPFLLLIVIFKNRF